MLSIVRRFSSKVKRVHSDFYKHPLLKKYDVENEKWIKNKNKNK